MNFKDISMMQICNEKKYWREIINFYSERLTEHLHWGKGYILYLKKKTEKIKSLLNDRGQKLEKRCIFLRR